MEKKDNNQRDNQAETRKGLKEINKIIFLPNEYVPDDWTEFELSSEEKRILKEAETYIDKELVPSLSISRKVTKEELADNSRPVREISEQEKSLEKKEAEVQKVVEAKKNKTLGEDEINEINMLLKTKAKTLKMREAEEVEKKEKYKRTLEEEEDKKKREEIERLHH